jgi:hypothetical protein
MQVKPTLFLEFQGSNRVSLDEQVSMTESIVVNDFGGSNFDFKSDEQERRQLWSARHDLLYATIAMRPDATSAFITDACVPLSHFAHLVPATAKDVEEKGIVGPCFGHAGDGNLHCILPLLEDESDEYLAKVHQVNENLMERTLLAGGTFNLYRRTRRGIRQNLILGAAIRTGSNDYDANDQKRSRSVQYHESGQSRAGMMMLMLESSTRSCFPLSLSLLPTCRNLQSRLQLLALLRIYRQRKSGGECFRRREEEF